MFPPYIVEKTTVINVLSIKYIIAPIMKTSIGLYHLYFSKVLGNVMYSEISFPLILIFLYLFAYNVNSNIFFMTFSENCISLNKSDFQEFQSIDLIKYSIHIIIIFSIYTTFVHSSFS